MKKAYIVGIGPGSFEEMTIRAARILQQCDVIIGYPVYIDLIKPYYPDKEYLSTPMTREAERCRLCLEEAARGRTAALICSGDPGIYGLAGLMYAVREEYPQVELETISGVTAASAGSALLGAPLIQDFAVISLSDRLTPWETIEQRILAAAAADMVICLYNPASRKRTEYLRKACDLMLRSASADTVCGLVENIARKGESVSICTLGELRDRPVNMFTTVYIGCSRTRIIDGKMVTPRGYHLELV